MKHAIIPTDFTIRSLQSIHDVMNHYNEGQVKITLLHLVDVPDAIGDLLFRLRRMESRYPVPDAFRQACEVMRNKYDDRLAELKITVQYGTTPAYLENLLEGFKTDHVFIQSGYELGRPFNESIPMLPLIRRCDCRVVETQTPYRTEQPRMSTIGDLLLAGS